MTTQARSSADIVVGASVAGRALATRLRTQGRTVTLVNRSGGSLYGLAVTACPAEQLRDLNHDWSGHTRLFLCAAPAYHRWSQEFPQLIEGVCRAVEGRSVDIVFLDNMYAYGLCNVPFAEDSPYQPNSVKGKVRAAAAQRLMALHNNGRVRVCIVRAASFFGPGVEAALVGKQVWVNALAGRTVNLLGNPNQPHTMSYLPDVVNTLACLADEPAAYGHSWHVPNDWHGTVREMVAHAVQGSGKTVQERVAGRHMVRMIGLFSPHMREMQEMMYLFEQRFSVSHAKTAAAFHLQATPWKTAIAETLAWCKNL